jgi:hypothetical protein
VVRWLVYFVWHSHFTILYHIPEFFRTVIIIGLFGLGIGEQLLGRLERSFGLAVLSSVRSVWPFFRAFVRSGRSFERSFGGH